MWSPQQPTARPGGREGPPRRQLPELFPESSDPPRSESVPPALRRRRPALHRRRYCLLPRKTAGSETFPSETNFFFCGDRSQIVKIPLWHFGTPTHGKSGCHVSVDSWISLLTLAQIRVPPFCSIRSAQCCGSALFRWIWSAGRRRADVQNAEVQKFSSSESTEFRSAEVPN